MPAFYNYTNPVPPPPLVAVLLVDSIGRANGVDLEMRNKALGLAAWVADGDVHLCICLQAALATGGVDNRASLRTTDTNVGV